MHGPRKRYISRRTFLRQGAAIGSAAALTQSNIPFVHAQRASKPALDKGGVVLFQGDSITDAGRDRKRPGANDPRALGFGYPAMIASRLLGTHAGNTLRCFNRGISGNKVPDLDARWQEDCLDLKPDVLSVLIGVNDIWHKLDGRYDGTVEDYEAGFSALIEKTREALPGTALVICEPFVLRCGAVTDKWFPEFDRRREAARRVSDAAGATWVPFQSMFDDVLGGETPPSYWAGDGVHPTMAGHALMAQTWLESTGLE